MDGGNGQMAVRTQVPDGWRVARLEEVARERNQRANSGLRADVMSITNDLGFVQSREKFERQVFSQDTSNYKVVRRGDIAYNPARLNVGSIGILTDHEIGIVSPMYVVFESDTTQSVPEFLFRLLNLPSLFTTYRRLGEGTVRSSIGFHLLRDVVLAIPPKDEQEQILVILGAIDEAIVRTEEAIAATERLRDSLLHELLSRGVPGWHSAWKESPGIGTIPSCWDAVRLGDVAEVRNGTTPSRAETNYWQDGDVPFIKTGQVNDTLIEVPDEFITSQAVASAGAVVVPRGSVLIAMIGQGKTRGMTAQLKIDAAINQNFAAVFGADGDFSLDFFFTWASHNYSHIRALGQGSNQDALNCALIEGMRVPKPTLAEQQSIVAMTNSIYDAIE